MSNALDLFNQLVLSLQDLNDTFNEAVAAFNNRDWAHLGKDLLDKQVVAGSITHPTEIHSGIDDVIQYLTDSGGHFEPLSPPLTVPFAKLAHLSGIATWKDKDDTREHPIVYGFVFVDRGDRQPDWRILRLFATSSLA